MKVDIYNKSGKKSSGKIELNNKIFKVDPNEHCIYLAVKSELAAKRQGTSSSKTRSEVSGGGRKPYRQKGTGNAAQDLINQTKELQEMQMSFEKLKGSGSYLYLRSGLIERWNILNKYHTYPNMINPLKIETDSIDKNFLKLKFNL